MLQPGTDTANVEVAASSQSNQSEAAAAASSAWAVYWESLKDCLQHEQAFTELPDIPGGSVPHVIIRAVAIIFEQVVHVAVLDSETPKLQVYPMLPGD